VLELYGAELNQSSTALLPVDADGVAALSWQELQILARRVVGGGGPAAVSPRMHLDPDSLLPLV
jgi:hypothetical protein